MSELERQAAACLLASFPGPDAPDWICRWLERGLGGIVLFSDNVRDREQLGALTASLRAERPGLVVAIDEEGGDVTRLEAATGSSYPGNLALGAVDDPGLTRAVAESIAAELAAAGVTMNLAPVADVNSNPRNPVIGVRSFGSDPSLVARHVAAFVEATQARGVAACAKHFPGHGDTAVDSHLALPTVGAGREELDAGPLVPFRAAIEAGTRAVMTAHIVVPAIDEAPATLSRRVVTGLLRDELGFTGTVISDALEMRAVSGTVGLEQGAVRALAAGVDAVCLGRLVGEDDVERVHRAIVEAVSGGDLAADRIADAAESVEQTGRWASSAAAGAAPDRAAGGEAARRALRVRGEVGVTAPPLVVELEPEPMIAAGPSAHGLGEALRRRLPGTAVTTLREPPSDLGAVLRSDAERPVVLVLRDAARYEWQRSLAAALVAFRPDAVIVETGLPGWLPTGASGSIETFGAGRVNLEAAADRLTGAV
jgi:beta-N-acetylhexosaminidase